MNRVGIFILAYEVARTLIAAYERIPAQLRKEAAEIYILDDASNDNTFSAGMGYKLLHNIQNLNVYRNPRNLGYGGNQKKGMRHAIDRGYNIVVVLHGDVQYAPERIPDLIQPILEGQADMVFGSRMTGHPLQGGMPLYKFVANKALTALENWVLGMQLSEYHSGFRAYSCEALLQVPFEECTDHFYFDTQILIQFKEKGLRIREIPIPTHYGPESQQMGFGTSVRYGFGILGSLLEYRLRKSRLVRLRSRTFGE
jgi:glycosyltransferase involved in cell wall biosynthesis